MKRSTWIPLLAVAIALVVLFFIFFASRPGDVVVEGGEVIEGLDDNEAVPDDPSDEATSTQPAGD